MHIHTKRGPATYYRARYYEPLAGRFLNEDPATYIGGINFYRYAANRPNVLVDPRGLAPDCAMTSHGMECQPRNAVDNEINLLHALFPSSTPQGLSLTIQMSCDDVKTVLANTHSYYVGGFWGSDQWADNDPFLFWDPVAHHGGDEGRSKSGFHFRIKYPDGKNCKTCTLDQFHVDTVNPMYDAVGHTMEDFIPYLLSKVGINIKK